MAKRKPAEFVTASFILKVLNSKPVLIWTRFCLRIARDLKREAGFEVTAQFRGSIIGISPIIFGKREEITYHEDVVRDLDSFWHTRQNRPARPPKTSQLTLATIHCAPVDSDDTRIMVPSQGDLDTLRWDRRQVFGDHDVPVRSLCIEIRPYKDKSRLFIVQEQRPHSEQSTRRAVAAASRAAKRHYAPIINVLGAQGYNICYTTFTSVGFKIRKEDLEPFEFSIRDYRGK